MSRNAKELLNQLNTPEDLRRLLDVRGIDDAVIEQFVAVAGSEAVLDHLFDIMATRFKPGPLRTGTVQWKISSRDGCHIYHLTLTRRGATASKGASANARITLSMGVPTLLRLCAGRLEPIPSFFSSKFEVQGNLLFGAFLPQWFLY